MAARGHMPLVVDVDGTLIKSNLLLESALKLFKQSPASLDWIWTKRPGRQPRCSPVLPRRTTPPRSSMPSSAARQEQNDSQRR